MIVHKNKRQNIKIWVWTKMGQVSRLPLVKCKRRTYMSLFWNGYKNSLCVMRIHSLTIRTHNSLVGLWMKVTKCAHTCGYHFLSILINALFQCDVRASPLRSLLINILAHLFAAGKSCAAYSRQNIIRVKLVSSGVCEN